MRTEFCQKEYVSSRTWKILDKKFSDEFSELDLKACYFSKVPVFVRHNNRNIYANVYKVNDGFIVSDFYRLTRDGYPVRLYIERRFNGCL